MSQSTHRIIQRVIGWMCALGFFVLAYFSMQTDLTLQWPVIVGCIVIIAALLGKLEAFAKLLEAWTGR